MARPFRKLEVLMDGTVYVFDRDASETLLERLDTFKLSERGVLWRLREDLRAALATEVEVPAEANPFDGEEEETPEAPPPAPRTAAAWPVTGGVVKDVSAENAEADSAEKTPRCRFCEQPGKRAGARKDGLGRIVERYYVCETEGCIAAKARTPQSAGVFSGGAR